MQTTRTITARHIERIAEKLHCVATAMLATDSDDMRAARELLYIISEARVCADLIKSEDRQTRIAGFDRWDDILTTLTK